MLIGMLHFISFNNQLLPKRSFPKDELHLMFYTVYCDNYIDFYIVNYKKIIY